MDAGQHVKAVKKTKAAVLLFGKNGLSKKCTEHGVLFQTATR